MDDQPPLPLERAPGSLATRPEDQWFERKSGRVGPRQLAEALVAFANADGGVVAVGISEGGFDGVDPQRENELRQAAMDFTVPPVRHTVERLPLTPGDGPASRLLLFHVPPSDTVHRTARDEVFLRIGDETRRLRGGEAQELEYDKGQSVFDGRILTQAKFDDFDPELVDRFLRSVAASSPAGEVLAARGLAGPRERDFRPTNAGMLVLGREPQRFFPEACVRVLQYQGSRRESGERHNVLSDSRFEGPLPRQLEAARLAVRRLMPATTSLASSGRFEPRPLLPEAAWLEAIVNAVVHRSYSIAGDHIRVSLFEDRMEVESPGRLPGLVRMDNIRATRYARNPRIARALADLGYGRELGEGVDRMFEEMERRGLPDPIYSEPAASVHVSLLQDSPFARALRGLTPALLRLVEFGLQKGTFTTTEAVHLLGYSRPTTLAQLRELAAAGILQHVGSSMNDPRGAWRMKR